MNRPDAWLVLALGGLLVWWLLGAHWKNVVSLDPLGIEIKPKGGAAPAPLTATPEEKQLYEALQSV